MLPRLSAHITRISTPRKDAHNYVASFPQARPTKQTKSGRVPLEQPAKALLQISLQVAPVLDADADSHELAVTGVIAHGPPLDQALDATQARGVCEELEQTRQRLGHGFALHRHGEYRPVPACHLLLDPRLALQAGVGDFLDDFSYYGDVSSLFFFFAGGSSAAEPSDEVKGVLALSLDPELEGSEAPEPQPALEAAHDVSEIGSLLE
jgi:hypothetical protein